MSTLVELIGGVLVAVAIAFWATWEAGLLFAGLFLLFVGAMMDDAAAAATVQRLRAAWDRSRAREAATPALVPGSPDAWVPCPECGAAEEGCAFCAGLGFVPDPNYQEDPESPHPPLQVDPESEAFWSQVARSRTARAKRRD